MEVPESWLYFKCGLCGVFLQDEYKMANHLRSHVNPEEKFGTNGNGREKKAGIKSHEVFAHRVCLRPTKAKVQIEKLKTSNTNDHEIRKRAEVYLDSKESLTDKWNPFASTNCTLELPSQALLKTSHPIKTQDDDDDEDWLETDINYEDFELPEDEPVPQQAIVCNESISTPELEISAQCPFCDEFFTTDSGLQGHIEQTHGNRTETCQICFVTGFTAGGLKRHGMLKHAEKEKQKQNKQSSPKNTEKFLCPPCKKHFKSHRELQQHTKGHWMQNMPLSFEHNKYQNGFSDKYYKNYNPLANVNRSNGKRNLNDILLKNQDYNCKMKAFA